MTRQSGVLLHITSLPSRYGIGDIGPVAHCFAHLLHNAGQRVWQFLPLNPVAPVLGNSPYSSPSAFAGNALLISPDLLVEEGFATGAQAESLAHAVAPASPDAVDFALVEREKRRFLGAVFSRFAAEPGTLDSLPGYRAFCSAHASWLDDYAAFCVLKEEFNGKAWYDWPAPYATRDADSMALFRAQHSARLDAVRFEQFLFFRQWARLRGQCESLGIALMGDVPIYVTHDSADVWANPHYFMLGPDNMPLHVAGVPPDYFSETGQRWGNPVYNWDALAADNYAWWVRRLRHNLLTVHLTRLDHFRGFAGFWAIPAADPTAVNGHWHAAPGAALFATLERELADFAQPVNPPAYEAVTQRAVEPAAGQGENARYTLPLLPPGEKTKPAPRRLPLIAEDLGVITPDVLQLKQRHCLPGMKVLQFGLLGDLLENPHAPFNHEQNAVVYTGTHDNATTRGWFAALDTTSRAELENFIGQHITEETAHRVLMRMALASPAELALIPMQDVLGLGDSARMNTPSTPAGNWTWRMRAAHMLPQYFEELKLLTRRYAR